MTWADQSDSVKSMSFQNELLTLILIIHLKKKDLICQYLRIKDQIYINFETVCYISVT